MNLVPWKGKTEDTGRRAETVALPTLRREIDDLFDRFFREPFGTQLGQMFGNWGGGLRTDLAETDDEVVVRAEMPGVDPKDVDINVTGNILTLSGEKKEEREDKRRNYHYMERQFGSFQRAVQLPAYVDPHKVEATFKNGVLTVTIAKKPDFKPRKIKVTGG
jgi:HSP20 family protein